MKEVIGVLIIEDDPMVSHINRKYTEKLDGFRVIEEVNIDNGMDIKSEDLEEANLLLLDIYLPGKDGITLLKEIRDSKDNLDAIIISASKDTKHISDAMQWGAVDYLIKPFTFERFKKALLDYKKRKERLADQTGLQQEELDSLIGKMHSDKIDNQEASLEIKSKNKKRPKPIRDLPKGLNDVTLTKIKNFMEQNEKEVSTKEIAGNLNLSRVTIQRYLKYLSDIGATEVIREYGTVGRPKHYYKILD